MRTLRPPALLLLSYWLLAACAPEPPSKEGSPEERLEGLQRENDRFRQQLQDMEERLETLDRAAEEIRRLQQENEALQQEFDAYRQEFRVSFRQRLQEGGVVESVVLRDGQVLEQVVAKRLLPDGLLVQHSIGVAKVPFARLPLVWQEAFNVRR
ncbi:MAG: hypothetical protein AAF555_07305 [Verrucomicrobiota bacterium]